MQEMKEKIKEEFTEKTIKKTNTKLNLLLIFLSTLTFMLLWNWFLVPVGLPVIGYLPAFGITLTIGFTLLSKQHLASSVFDIEPAEELVRNIAYLYSNVIAIIFGFILQFFI